MKVNVTAEHIKSGKPMSSDCCPVALAINEIIGHSPVVLVGHTNISIWPLGKAERYYKTPEEVAHFISAFDKGEAVEPFSFELDD